MRKGARSNGHFNARLLVVLAGAGVTGVDATVDGGGERRTGQMASDETGRERATYGVEST